jgi:AMP-polyphosphate phosphotransferase
MFETPEIGHKISKAEWKREIPGLREGLLDAQLDLRQSKKFPVIILVAGVDCAGKGGSIRRITQALGK